MSDILFALITVAFFALCALYVRACDRIVRASDDPAERTSEARS